jgi:hypothetical protein
VSTVGGGEVVLLPAAAVGVVAGAAILTAAGAVFVGGVVAYQTGKAVVACGRKVGEAVQDHVARQRAINQLCADFEQRTLQIARQGRAMTQTADLATQLQRLNRLNGYREVARLPQPAPAPALPPDPGLEEEAPRIAVYTQGDLDRLANQLEVELSRLDQQLTIYEQPDWIGLVDLSDLRSELAGVKKAIANNRRETTAPTVTTYRDLRQQVYRLQADLAIAVGEGRVKYEKRQRVAVVLAETATRLEGDLRQNGDSSDLAPMLLLAVDTLDRADALLQAGHLDAALEAASTTAAYLDRLNQSLDGVRRTNLEVALAGLRDYVAGFEFPSGDNAPLALNSLIAKAEGQLAANDLDACWTTIEIAQAEVGRLAEGVVLNLQILQRDEAARLARQILADMGYQVQEQVLKENGVAIFKAVRDDGAYFWVWASPDGLLQYKAEGFGTTECQTETKRFFDLLQEEGMVVNAQSELNLAAASERIRELLLRQGFAMVEVEEALDGNGLIITATDRQGKQQQLFASHDTPPAAATEGPAATGEDPHLSLARRLQQEAQAQYMRAFHARMKRRLRN